MYYHPLNFCHWVSNHPVYISTLLYCALMYNLLFFTFLHSYLLWFCDFLLFPVTFYKQCSVEILNDMHLKFQIMPHSEIRSTKSIDRENWFCCSIRNKLRLQLNISKITALNCNCLHNCADYVEHVLKWEDDGRLPKVTNVMELFDGIWKMKHSL